MAEKQQKNHHSTSQAPAGSQEKARPGASPDDVSEARTPTSRSKGAGVVGASSNWIISSAVVLFIAVVVFWLQLGGLGESQSVSSSPQDQGDFSELRDYVDHARDHIIEYVSNPGSKITVPSSRREVAERLLQSPPSRILEEYAKVLCVQGQGVEASNALSKQRQLAELGFEGPTASAVMIREAQIYFTRGDLPSVRKLLEGVLDAHALRSAPQWWGHLQWHAALRWSGESRDADMVLTNLCLEAREKLSLKGFFAGGPCGGPLSLGKLSVPDTTRLGLRDESRRYGEFPNVLPAAAVEQLRHYFLQLAEKETEGGRKPNDRRLGRHGWHNDPLAGFYHYMVANALREMDSDLVPTFVYTIVYLPGGQLLPHLDRPDNEVSLTVSLGSDPPGFVWPISMDGKNFSLQPGDGVLYRGPEVSHARDPLPPDVRSLHIIFGFRRKCLECCHLV